MLILGGLALANLLADLCIALCEWPISGERGALEPNYTLVIPLCQAQKRVN
jgi:hypothetical protein